MPMTPREMIKHLRKNGFHVKMRNDATGHQTIVPYHCTSLKKGLEQTILKQAGFK